jgi:hypothetical protein
MGHQNSRFKSVCGKINERKFKAFYRNFANGTLKKNLVHLKVCLEIKNIEI